MAGYLLVPHEKVPENLQRRILHVCRRLAVVDHIPGQRFQTGLFGTWMFARKTLRLRLNSIPTSRAAWAGGGTRSLPGDTKFIMGRSGAEFQRVGQRPGPGKEGVGQPNGKYGIAHSAPGCCGRGWPEPQQGTCGELFGYGYLRCRSPAKTTTRQDIRLGTNLDALLDTPEFQRAVAFFTPFFWFR